MSGVSGLDGIRLAFSVVAVTLLLLLYLALYRPTRAAYAGWWCLSLTFFLGGEALYVADGTAWQRVANPFGNAIIVLGAAAAWAGACSLRDRRPPWWQIAGGPAAVGVWSGFGHPATNVWPGGSFFLEVMAIYFALGAVQMWQLSRQSWTANTGADDNYRVLTVAMAFVLVVLTLFYLGRGLSLAIVGQSGRAFRLWFGTAATLIVQMVLLMVVGFSVSALSNEQRVRELRLRATRDGLTGLLNRGEFLRLAGERLRSSARHRRGCVLVMADLDHFKDINDRFGHGVGDQALRAFSRACTSAMRDSDVLARIGGEEFAILLVDAEPSDAERVTQRIRDRYHQEISLPDTPATASFGIAPLERGVDLAAMMKRADAALYRAKEAGRDRAVHYRG